MNTHRLRTLSIAVSLFLLVAGAVSAFGIGNVDGVWSSIDTNGAECDGWASMTGSSFPWSTSNPSIQSSGGFLTDENQVRYGDPAYVSDGCPDSRTEFLAQSGFGFDGVNTVVGVDVDEPFFLGSFKHYNNPIYASDNRFDWVDLAVSVPIDCDGNGITDTTFSFVPRFYLDETDNGASPCKYPEGPNGNGCSDQVLIEQPANTTFVCGEDEYTVNIHGFTSGASCSTVFDPDAVSTRFLTSEQATNSACLWAEIDALPADVAISKACELYTYPAQRYRITVVNNGPGTALGATITDTLPAGVSLASWTSTRTVGGVPSALGTCSAVGQTVTCQLNGSLAEVAEDSTANWVVDLRFTGDPGFGVNTATVSTTSIDPVPGNNSADAICTVPSAVGLVSFAAVGGESAIEVTWETASELNNVGFNLYRAESAEGERVKLNGDLIPARALGSVSGAAYSYTDSAVVAGATYYYWLEDVDASGAATIHGPVTASLSVSAPPAEEPPSVPPVTERPERQPPVRELPRIVVPLPRLPGTRLP
ncbi:MAG: DUF11 domain-containing protein [Chloroflexi bacterium]|nr:DUF11 domain-containing protein [Chloroflexota bacterium]